MEAKGDLLLALALSFKKMINGSLCMHIVLKQKGGIIIKFKGQIKTTYISMVIR